MKSPGPLWRAGTWDGAGRGISGLPAVPGSVGGRDLAALGPSLPRPSPGRGKDGPQGKRGKPTGGDQRSPDPLFRPWLVPWVTLALGRGTATAFSPAPPRLQGRGWRGGPGIRGRGGRSETAGMGAGEAGAGSARPAQLRPEAAGNSAQRWVSLSPLGWGCRAPG